MTIDRGKIARFLALTFGISWTTALVLHLLDVDLSTPLGQGVLVVFFMWGPALAALVVQHRADAPIRSHCRVRLGGIRWLALAWMAPGALVGLVVLLGASLPGVSITTDLVAALVDRGIPVEAAEELVTMLEELPVPPVAVLLAQGLLAGLTVNALAAFGEELGWRGLLLAELEGAGFWRASAFIGLVWGLWHAPIILQGHNFPRSPIPGVAVMTVWTVAIAPVFTYLTWRADSVLAPTLFHGTFNAVGSVSLAYLDGAGPLIVSPVGLVGVAAAVLASMACLAHDRYAADRALITAPPQAGGP